MLSASAGRTTARSLQRQSCIQNSSTTMTFSPRCWRPVPRHPHLAPKSAVFCPIARHRDEVNETSPEYSRQVGKPKNPALQNVTQMQRFDRENLSGLQGQRLNAALNTAASNLNSDPLQRRHCYLMPGLQVFRVRHPFPRNSLESGTATLNARRVWGSNLVTRHSQMFIPLH